MTISYGSIKVIFDDKKKRVAFVAADGIANYDYKDIKKWQWNWKEVEGEKTDNAIHFTVQNKDIPLIRVSVKNAENAEEWDCPD